MLLTLLLLVFGTLVSALPQEGLPMTPAAIPPVETCPASTPVTRVYVTTVTTTTEVERRCPTFITRVDNPPLWSTCSFNTLTCIRPLCLAIRTITQPCITDPCCTRTATDTVYATCAQSCPTGCATSWEIVSASCSTARPRPTLL